MSSRGEIRSPSIPWPGRTHGARQQGAAVRATADTALRLARALGITPEFWLNLQQSYELRLAEQDKETAAAVRSIRRVAGYVTPL